jgi:CHAT domain-containing protein
MEDKSGEGCAYSNLGLVFKAFRAYDVAIEHFEKSLKIDVLLGKMCDRHKTYYNLGSTYYFLGTDCIETRHDIKLYKDSISKSEKYFRKALQCCESMFDQLQDRDDLKISIVDTFIDTNKYLTEILIGEDKVKEALLVSERGKARALSDLLFSKYHIPLGNAKSVQLKYDEVERVLSKSDVCLLYFSLQFRSVALWVLAPEKGFYFLGNEIKCLNEPTVHCEEANEAIAKAVTAAYKSMGIEEAVVCENRSLESPEHSRLDTVKNLSSERNATQEEENVNKDKHSENKTSLTNPLETLYSVLFPSTYVIRDLIQKDVVIIPDGPLYRVPFAALRDPDTGLFLSEMKSIRIAPSLTTLKILQECPASYHSKTGALVVGDPHSGEVMFRGEKTTFDPLPKAQHEAKIIGDILNVTPLIGSQATKDVIQQRLREGVAVIHIAAHGNTEGEIALAPCTSTATGSTPEEQFYMLTMKEVQETGIRAQLVVLSCCHSGRGEIKAEGIVGISRAFLAAGARAVVASLWAIDDKATLNFMVSFYTYLKMGESASKSLQQAMKDMREDGYDEPRHWAPFFLIGDDVTISI